MLILRSICPDNRAGGLHAISQFRTFSFHQLDKIHHFMLHFDEISQMP